MTVLSEEQRKFYEKNGYVIIKKFIKTEVIDAIKKRCKDVCEGTVDKGVINVVKERHVKDAEGQYAVNKIQDFCYDTVFKRYTEDEALLQVLEAFLGSNLTCINSAFVLKPPNNKQEYSEHPVHQDRFYFPYRPADKLISVWTALTEVTPENGCLYVMPGSHKDGLYPHRYLNPSKKNVGYLCVAECVNKDRLDLVMGPGDTVFFHPLLLHGSYDNKSQELREAINCDYCDSFVEVYDLKGTVQEHIGAEFEEICMKKTGNCHSYVEVFQMKSKCVKGSVGNFNSKLQGQTYL